MAFKQNKDGRTIEACVKPAPGGMFKGYVLVTMTTHSGKVIDRSTGKRAGRPVRSEAEAMSLAEAAAKRMLGESNA